MPSGGRESAAPTARPPIEQPEVCTGPIEAGETVEATGVAAVEAIGERGTDTLDQAETSEIVALATTPESAAGLQSLDTIQVAAGGDGATREVTSVAGGSEPPRPSEGLQPADTSAITNVARSRLPERGEHDREVTSVAAVEEVGEHPAARETSEAAAIVAVGPRREPSRRRAGLVLGLCCALGAMGGIALRLVASRADAGVATRAGLGETVHHGGWSVRADAVERPSSRSQALLRVELQRDGARGSAARPPLHVSDGRQLIAPRVVAWSNERPGSYRLLFRITRDHVPLELRFAPRDERMLLVSLR
jgi:hypothetical protein